MIVLLALALLAASLRLSSWICRLLLGAAILAAAAHLAFEGARWQMVPVYTVLACWGGGALGLRIPPLRAWVQARGSWFAWTARAGAAGLLLTAGVAAYLFPMFQLPEPSGPYAIGTRTFDLVDANRLEPHTVEPFDHRELMVRVWYPAQPARRAKPVSYMDDADRLGPAIAKGYGLPLPFVFSHLKAIPSHAYPDAPISARRATYPVLVFSHGRDVYGAANTVLMEEMASRGYVVVGVDHAYGSTATVFSDGRIARFVAGVYEATGRRAPPSAHRIAVMERAQRAIVGFDVPEIRAAVAELDRGDPQALALNRYGLAIWSADQRFVIDQLERWQSGGAGGPFAGRLDLSRLGVFGMSFGGSATVETCALDSRCKAGLDLDGFTSLLLDLPPPSQPFLYASGGEQNLNLAQADRALGPAYWMKVGTSKHGDFTDLPMVTRLWRLVGLSGSIAPRRMLALTNDYVGAFFDKHLMGVPEPLLDGPSAQYPEVRLRVQRPAAPAP